MGKETKIGLGVVAVLLIVLAVVVTMKLTGSSPDTVAETNEPAAKSSDSATAKAATTLKPVATTVTAKKPTLAAKRNTSGKLAPLPPPPIPSGDGPRRPAGWARAGDNQSSPSQTQSGSSLFVLDPPDTSRPGTGSTATRQQYQPKGLSPQRYGYDRQRTSVGAQTPNYRAQYGRTAYQNVSASRGAVDSRNYGGYQQNYGSQHAVAPPAAVPQRITTGPRADGTYEVQPNDSYWRISKMVYGNGVYFKALAEHNRKDHPVADQLRVGDSISTPSLARLVDDYPDFCPSPRRRKTLEKRSNVIAVSAQYAGGDSYTVQNGDTLYDIARYELDDSSRWVEIYELNRHVIQGDFDYLTPGMKLVMPREAGGSIAPDRITRRPALHQPPSRNILRR